MKIIYSADPEDPGDTALDVLADATGSIQINISTAGEVSFNDNEVSKKLDRAQAVHLWAALGREVWDASGR